MELWIARQRRDRDKTCGRFNAAIYGAVAIALREDRKCPRELIREGGRTMLVLEDPGGEPLERLLGVPFEMDLFVRLAIDISVAVGRLHRRGLLHKDIKPANIMVNCAD